MAIRICIQCDERYTKGVSGFDIFPKDDHHWCSDKCLFLWMIEHNVRCNGEPITQIQRRRDKALLDIGDCVKVEDLMNLKPGAYLQYITL